MRDKSNDTGANLVRHLRHMCIFRCLFYLKTFSHNSQDYQHDLNENFFFPKNER